MKESEEINTSDKIIEIYSYETENPDKRKLVYRIDKEKKEIKFFPDKGSFSFSEIFISGFENLPPEFSDTGYIKGGLMYYLNKKFSQQNIREFIISRTSQSSSRMTSKGRKLILNYNDFHFLKKKITEISFEEKLNRSIFVDEFFYKTFPKLFKKVILSAKKRALKVIRNLDTDIIDVLSREDIDLFLDFFEALLKTKYKSEIQKRKLFNYTKVKIDNIAIEAIIKSFQEMILGDYSEDKWGNFLKQNLFLIDSKYIHALPELNVCLASARKVDFGLIDVQGYLDIFEIKKPSTPLISKKQDRGNYYWSLDATKAIIQAEKYLHHAERKAPTLIEDIRSQRGQNVEVIKPRAFIVIGNSSELNNQEKKNDFRILRMSLKNVEVLLYDELLERIKNQKDKVYIN